MRSSFPPVTTSTPGLLVWKRLKQRMLLHKISTPMSYSRNVRYKVLEVVSIRAWEILVHHSSSLFLQRSNLEEPKEPGRRSILGGDWDEFSCLWRKVCFLLHDYCDQGKWCRQRKASKGHLEENWDSNPPRAWLILAIGGGWKDN